MPLTQNLVFLLIVGTATAAGGSPAHAGSYESYLMRLEKRVVAMSTHGFDATEIERIQAFVNRRPEVSSPADYQPFMRTISVLYTRIARHGITRSKHTVLKILKQVRPPLPSTPPRGLANKGALDRYQTFLKTMTKVTIQLNTHGFTNLEVRSLATLKSMAPTLIYRKAGYQAAYRIWSSTQSRIETKLRVFGIDQNEKVVLGHVDALKPVLYRPPVKIVRKPRPIRPTPSVTPAKSFRVCGRTFRVVQVMDMNIANKHVPMYLMRKANGELVEINTANCRVRFITDHVKTIHAQLEDAEALVLRTNGEVYWFNRGLNVYSILSNAADFLVRKRRSLPGHHCFRMRNRTTRCFFIGEGPTPRGLPITDGRQIIRYARTLYRTVWRQP
jgi:hypothetical protein